MVFLNTPVIWFASLVRLIVAVNVVRTDESVARDFLRSLNNKSAEISLKLVGAQWDFETTNSENSKEKLFQLTSEAVKNAKSVFQNVINNHTLKSFTCPNIQRQLKLFSEIGTLALPEEKYHEFQKIFFDLGVIQRNTTICDYFNKTKCDLRLNPDIREKLETSQNAGELSYLWTEWKKATEPEFINLLESYVNLSNEAATLNNYTNFQKYSLRNIDAQDVKEEMIALWNDIKPLYSQIHAYVRKKLRDIYGEKIVPRKGLIPAYLLGHIWTENWLGISQRVIPFPEYDNFNFTLAMYNQGYSVELIHKSAEEFFASMNFTIPSDMWFNVSGAHSARNSDNCLPKIFNFYPGGLRIKDCEKISLTNYLEDIRLLTKAEYMLQYSGQPFVYQASADPGLEEAVNDLMIMSASTFNNLNKLGLYKGKITEEIRLNRLFKLALEKVTSIPFLLVQEFWRWQIYSRNTVTNSMNVMKDLREKFQGISTFTKELTFDPGGIGSAFSKLSLVHRFLSYFLEFQLYESFCQISKENQREDDLNECNLYKNVEAGLALRNMMSLGSSKTLTETISSVLGVNKISSNAILKYFEPLMIWLTKENQKTGEFIGWEESEHLLKKDNLKKRRKRSLEDYSSDAKDIDSDITPSREPDRFQRLIYKRSKNNVEEFEMNERDRESLTTDQNSEKKSKSSLAKQRRNADEAARKLFNTKNTPLTQSKSSGDDSSEEKGRSSLQKFNKLAPKNMKRHSGFEAFEPSYDKTKPYMKTLSSSGESSFQKRNDDYATIKKNNNNLASGNNLNNNRNIGSGNGNVQNRYNRASQKQREYDNKKALGPSHQIWRRNEYYQNQKDKPSRYAQWHSDTKKDISRFLHSFGFAGENDEKDKIKELKKKLKGDSNVDLNSDIDSKENTYGNVVHDFNRMKSMDGRSETGEDKAANKLWSVKTYLTDNAKIVQGNPPLDKKESLSSFGLPSSLKARRTDEKSISKLEASPNSEANLVLEKDLGSESSESNLVQNNDAGIRHLNIDLPSLQVFLQRSDLNSFGQKPIYTLAPELSENKVKFDGNSINRAKSSFNKYGNSYLYKYIPAADTSQFKEKKEFKEDTDSTSKSPYIIILGQIAPDVKEKLMQEKGISFVDLDKPSPFQGESNTEEKKISDKRSRQSEQIYIVPIDLKNPQYSLMKPNHYAEHEHEVGHDAKTERDQETEEEQLHLEDNAKSDDKSSFYKSGKDNPSEFIISWNNDKNRKIVKRRKREHKKEIGDDRLKVVRIAPMKESFLGGLLGKTLDANLDDKNVKIYIHDGMLNGNSELAGPQQTMAIPVGMGPALMDQSQTASLQPSSSLSSISSNIVSAFTPKSYSQGIKGNNQRQDSDLEEENLKENANAQGLVGKKKLKLFSDDDARKLIDADSAAKGDDACCKKIILSPCPPKCPGPCPCPIPCPLPCPLPCPVPCPCPSPCPCPGPCPCPCPSPCPCPCPTPCPCPCPDDTCKRIVECPLVCCKPECSELCCKKPSECSLVNCQFKITKAKKPHERLTIMIYDRINPPAELPEPYDALAVISEILQRIQSCSCKPSCQLAEEDPDYPTNDNSDQLKGNSNQGQDNKAKIQELSGEIPILGSENSEEDDTDESGQMQSSASSADEEKFQPKEKAVPAIDQLTVFNKDKLKPVFIELRKVDEILKKRSQKE